MNQKKVVETEASLKTGKNSSFFKSNAHEVAFYLSLNTAFFNKDLGIKPIHMINKEKAFKLRDSYHDLFEQLKSDELYNDLDYQKISKDIDNVFRRVTAGL